MQRRSHNTGIDKALDGIISIDKHGHTGFAWTKDKLGMYRGEATRRAARMGSRIAIFLLGIKTQRDTAFCAGYKYGMYEIAEQGRT